MTQHKGISFAPGGGDFHAIGFHEGTSRCGRNLGVPYVLKPRGRRRHFEEGLVTVENILFETVLAKEILQAEQRTKPDKSQGNGIQDNFTRELTSPTR